MILVTGFEPFANNRVNPSMILMEVLAQSPFANLDCLLLPVDWHKTVEILERQLALKKYQTIFHFGLASERTKISLERFAYNSKRANQTDNNQNSFFRDSCINPKGPAYIESNAPISKLFHHLENFEVPVEISTDPGRYLCNYLYYYSLQKSAFDKTIYSLFIHLPPLEPRSKVEQLAQVFTEYFKLI